MSVEESEAQRGSVCCPVSYNWWMAEPAFKFKFAERPPLHCAVPLRHHRPMRSVCALRDCSAPAWTPVRTSILVECLSGYALGVVSGWETGRLAVVHRDRPWLGPSLLGALLYEFWTWKLYMCVFLIDFCISSRHVYSRNLEIVDNFPRFPCALTWKKGSKCGSRLGPEQSFPSVRGAQREKWFLSDV